MQTSKSRQFGFAAFIALTIAAIVTVLNLYNIIAVPEVVAASIRWLAIGGLIAYAFVRRNLTTWILVSMVIGAEIGNDFPEIAMHLNIFSKVFLKLIKTIIAPLIFATLVVGIAGHSNLKQVGKMGVKALIYFEVVTTIALFIGLAAINISKAGEGIVLKGGGDHGEIVAPPKQSISDIILHVFPENIAKSIADGEVLQIVVFSVIFGFALAMLSAEKRKPMLHFAESLAEILF